MCCSLSWDTSVSIAVDCGLDNPMFKSWQEQRFPSSPKVQTGIHPTSHSTCAGFFFFSGVMQPGHEGGWWPPSSAEVKNK